MKFLNLLAQYLYLKKRDRSQPSTGLTKYMHGINRISLIIFIAAMIFLLVKKLFLPH